MKEVCFCFLKDFDYLVFENNRIFMEGKVNLIVAIGRDGAIGKNGELIWRLPEDLKHFKEVTTDHPVIMGRKTWESLPRRPLPARRNIILTRQKDFAAPGAEIVNSVEAALNITNSESPFIIGGAEIYKAFLPYTANLFITLIEDSCPEADTFLPLPLDLFKKIEESPLLISSIPSSPAFRYQIYERIKPI